MSKRLTFFDHIRLSVPHDTIARIGRRLVLTNGDEIMVVTLAPAWDADDEVADVTIAVTADGATWRTDYGNTTDTVSAMWSR